MVPTLATTVQHVFLCEIDNISRESDEGFFIEPQEFWQDIYEKRPGERLEFDTFLRSHTDFLILSGHVGSGKSTYLREKLEVFPFVYGLAIDVRRYAADFHAVETEDVARLFQTIVGKEFRRRILANLRYYILVSERPTYDITHRNDLIGPEVSREEWQSVILRDNARTEAATKALMLLDTEPINRIRTSLKCVGETDEQIENCLKEAVRAQDLSETILKELDWHDWPDLYRLIFVQPRSPLLIFDNLDVLPINKVLKSLVDSLTDILNRISRSSDVALNLGFALPPFKVVAAVRDENISHIRLQAGAAQRTMHIALGHKDKLLPVSRTSRLGVGTPFVQGVVERRLTKLIRQAPEEPGIHLFELLVRKFWLRFTQPRPDLLDRLGEVLVDRLNNYSLRLMLEMISHSTLQILTKFTELGLRPSFLESDNALFALKGFIIQSLQSLSTMEATISTLVEDMRREFEGGYCCRHRIILTFLLRRAGLDGISVSELWDSLGPSFDYDPDDLRQSLMDLYQSAARQGELVTIDQFSFPTKAEHIEDSAKVRVSGRGESLVDTVLLHIDFFGLVCGEPRGALLTLDPWQAAKYTREILDKSVDPLAKAHMDFWVKHLAHQFPDCGPDDVPFDYYAQEFTHGEAFFVNRVIDSHRLAIKVYIVEASQGPGARLMISEEAFRRLSEYLSSHTVIEGLSIHPMSLDEEIDVFFKRHALNGPFLDLWKTYKDYDKILRGVARYERMTLSQLRREAEELKGLRKRGGAHE